MVEKFNKPSTVPNSRDLSCSAVFKKEMYRRILWYYGRKFNTPSTVPNSKDLLHVQQCLKRKCTVEFCGTMVEKFNTSSTVPNSKDLSCSPVFKKEMYRRILWYYGRKVQLYQILRTSHYDVLRYIKRKCTVQSYGTMDKKFNTPSTVPNSRDLSHVQQCLKRKCTVEFCGTMVEKSNTSSTVPNSRDLSCSPVFKKEMYRRMLWYYGRKFNTPSTVPNSRDLLHVQLCLKRKCTVEFCGTMVEKFNTPSTVPNSIDHSLQCLTVLQKEMYHSQAYVVCLGGAEPLHSSATSPQTHHSLVSDLHYLKLLLNIIYILNKALNVSLFKIIEMDSIFF
ncbi:uncharacterized protein LOC127002346 isoform X21 [Eriocheir sinensis]|uniref:uncharacterized protein LOC127002346 isoform X21 n=1 Tax=Eriocheir sinensis TaxID=95602 RepID=UPI0021C731CA|nr:uncharacterized protein LOC127002346 isoform X21 [Eriocheir sinensis]